MRSPRKAIKRGGLFAAASVFVSVAVVAGLAHAETTNAEAAGAHSAVSSAGRAIGGLSAADYTAGSWAAYSAALSAATASTQRTAATATAEVQKATDGLVMVRGLKDLVTEYRTRPVDR